MASYSLYGDQAFRSISHERLLEEQRQHGLLLARAEDSGSEGCYVEVAKWNEARHRWERYCHEKVFGGEHPGDQHRRHVSAQETAEQFARDINECSSVSGPYASLIHSFPNYDGPPPVVVAIERCLHNLQHANRGAVRNGFTEIPGTELRELVALVPNWQAVPDWLKQPHPWADTDGGWLRVYEVPVGGPLEHYLGCRYFDYRGREWFRAPLNHSEAVNWNRRGAGQPEEARG